MTDVTRKLFITGLAAIALGLGSSVAFAQSAAKPGAKAPDFSVVDVDGKLQKLSDYTGKTVILEWTNHDCPYVRKHYNSATMQTLQKDMAKDGIVWLSVISSPAGEQGHVDAAKAKELTRTRDAAPASILPDPKSQLARA
ncbi:redoxin domain-containing protein [Bosea sp. (in: a-proteobacteria)]|uniref:redoxin domain-containing protein n=1 Tax=Bosea sp. (in: a-proteobacteria) TaxID=1871050 RepID=UPI0025C6FACD|nr:redoxin domain-containing protein [Bosea sp. (in: a-proteobacteria)]MBR3192518.1 redoxin domain-containing protein [Bosea sp. (in: a-proteobacteria)]